MKTSKLKTSLLAALAATTVSMPAALAEQMTVVTASEAGRNAHVVNKGIKWHTNFEEAQSQARKDGKLIFWMHMLGTIDGAT